jgi:hypothetical protein
MIVLEFGRGCRRNLGGEREKGGRNGRRRQTTVNGDTRATSWGWECQDLPNTASECPHALLEQRSGHPHTGF